MLASAIQRERNGMNFEGLLELVAYNGKLDVIIGGRRLADLLAQRLLDGEVVCLHVLVRDLDDRPS